MPGEAPSVHVLETVAAPSSLDQVHSLFDELWVDVPDVTPSDRMAFETAVAEVAANIVQHAAAGEEVAMRLVLHADVDKVEAQLEDGGHPYQERDAPPQVTDDELPEGGWGLAIARTLSDELVYERSGRVNRWYLTRRRSSPA